VRSGRIKLLGSEETSAERSEGTRRRSRRSCDATLALHTRLRRDGIQSRVLPGTPREGGKGKAKPGPERRGAQRCRWDCGPTGKVPRDKIPGRISGAGVPRPTVANSETHQTYKATPRAITLTAGQANGWGRVPPRVTIAKGTTPPPSTTTVVVPVFRHSNSNGAARRWLDGENG